MKRFFDVIVSLGGLLMAAPFMAAIAALVKLESRGPVFYRCTRVGKNGRLFGMLKFRTMVENADAVDCALCKGNDVRVTSFGMSFVKPGGGIIWYDYIYDNPWNPDVRGVPVSRIRELFPQGEFTIQRLTLAPPLGRVVTKISPILYTILNLLPFLRTHVLCWIKKT